MLIKCNDQWFDPNTEDQVMIKFDNNEDKAKLIEYIQNMVEEANCLAFFPDDINKTSEELHEWMIS